MTQRKVVEDLLAKQEAMYRAVVETSADGFLMVDQEGHIRLANDAYVCRSGYSREELMSMSIGDLEVDESPRDVQAHINKIIQNGADLFESRHRTKFGEVWPVEVSASHLEVGETLFVSFVRDLTERKALEGGIVEAASAEQERIGRELHDNVCQQLTAVTMLVGSLLRSLKAAGRTKEAEVAADINLHIQSALGEVRAISQGLSPMEVDPKGLNEALSELTARTAMTTGVDCRYHSSRTIDVKKKGTAMHLYRIAQEAIQNALKHAEPKRIYVSLERVDGHLVLTVTDDGNGIDLNKELHRGFRLRIMSHRCSIIRGLLRIETREEGGTLVCCRVPLRR